MCLEKKYYFAFGLLFSTFCKPICIKMVALQSPVSLLLRTSFFLKSAEGARSCVDFTLPRWKFERKYVIFPELHHNYCMELYSKFH